ncbi:serine--tRNA ligase [symbiont of Argiope bruennichi]|uniref:serine--tRNA ligase n=1 Tax=symbiont of Argiope bruennichi TaxID=2810479 RepID=UPI003DA5E606
MISIKDFEKDFNKYSSLLLSRGFSKKKSLKLLNSYRDFKKFLFEWESLKSEINNLSKKYLNLTDDEKIKLKYLKEKFKETANKKKLAEDLFVALWIKAPNVPRETSPITKKNCNYIVISENNFLKKEKNSVIHHDDFLKINNWIQSKNTNNIYGSRFVVFKKFGATLRQGLINFLISNNIKNNFEFYSFPYLLNEIGLVNSGQLPKFRTNLFKTSLNKYLSPTGEVQILNLFVHTCFDKNFTTKKICTYTECFRKEAGAAGKDTKGLIRLHQFGKIETFLFTKQENVEENFLFLVKNTTNLLDLLNLPYRIIELTRKELGISSAKTYDVEVWMPSQEKYVEIASCSLCTDYQSRRSNIKYLTSSEKKEYVYTYNCSALPIERLMAAIIENHQKDNKTIILPKALKKFLFN